MDSKSIQNQGEAATGAENQSLNNSQLGADSKNLTYRRDSVSAERNGGDQDENEPLAFINFIRQIYGLNIIRIPMTSAGNSRLEGHQQEPQIMQSNSQQNFSLLSHPPPKDKEEQAALLDKIYGFHQPKELPGIQLEDHSIPCVGALTEEAVNCGPAIMWARDTLK